MDHDFRSPTAKRFVNNLILDLYPERDGAVQVDFGFSMAADPVQLFAAYKHALKTGKATPEDFDKAVGTGADLTLIVATVDPDIIVQTDYDLMEV